VSGPVARLRIAPELRLFLAPRHRHTEHVEVPVALDGVSSLGHLVQSLGPPLTEVGGLAADGRQVSAAYRPRPGDVVDVQPVRRPQPIPDGSPRFVLDVHLGTLTRRLRLLGVDATYQTQADDTELVTCSAAERRILLTRDRGLLRRRAVWCAAYVYGDRPDGQLTDVLDRFAPPLAPWTRCTACNGLLEPVAKAAIEHLLEPGTRRSYHNFARCRACQRLYWRGAHAARLERLVAERTEGA
jgi:uncharacterized protein with PIN domain